MLDSVQASVIMPLTNMLAQVSGALMTMWDSDVMTYGRVIQSKASGFGVSIEAGCNGVEAAIILIAGIVAFPAPWRYKVAGIVVGIAAVQGANLLRIISLYYLGQYSMKWFDWAHLYAWDVLIMLDGVVVFFLWIRWLPPVERSHAPAAAG